LSQVRFLPHIRVGLLLYPNCHQSIWESLEMFLPAELRLLCHQLSSTPTSQLPNLTPTLVRNVLRCQGPLSSGGNSGTKSDASESSVLVYKLKTQVSTLLFGKSTEGRFAAVVLIKAIVAVGGWEVLRGVESWVRGLLSVLGVSEPVSKEENG